MANTQGLAEYTNANFASDDTIFTEDKPTDDRHYFPYPRKASTNLQDLENKYLPPVIVTAEDGVVEKSFYIKKIADCEKIDHFVKASYLSNNVHDNVGSGNLYNRTFYRDEECHKDYAKQLIPRAVGYSAGLLNYFWEHRHYSPEQRHLFERNRDVNGLHQDNPRCAEHDPNFP